ncbi:glycosyl hydrolase family 28-related protein [Anaeromyxobacter paludicola]|uniref:Rhamnogalacturonase A/B/Epimerase-like pectate lyase domain-containing protein n=1 Tax=Anaeromyxobacter paludicola TaxID=2918171 RepID=A0ABM7X9J5_9BACT|nr:glycosyl hydrolase family 28-related protein [Anaeromyxobacter paludicola]BDG08514.1 hypothetical protein AMPC_16270 [Anaeromyxobacter paludicola]
MRPARPAGAGAGAAALRLCAALAALACAPGALAAPDAPPHRFDVRRYGARGDGVSDDSGALRDALEAARRWGGGEVFFPAGTYLIAPARTARAGPRDGFGLASNTWLRGEGPRSVLRVKAGVGSYRALFSNYPAPASEVRNVGFADLRIDQNCGASGGTVREGGDGRNLFAVYLGWGGKGITVERVRFEDVCGVNTVVLNATAASGLVVRDSYFRFAKGPTDSPRGFYDNSAVYFHGRDALVAGNVFESTAADGARGAIELHGSRARAERNVTRWYHACVRLAGTSGPGEAPPAAGNAFVVSRNECWNAKDAINVWSITGQGVRGVTIADNRITLAENDHLAATGHLGYFFGISFVWDAVSGGLDGDVRDVVIERNEIRAQPADGTWGSHADTSGGISLRCGGDIRDVQVRGNLIQDVPTKGIDLQAMGRGRKASRVRIEDNRLVNPGNDPAAGRDRAGIRLGGALEDVEVSRNTITGTLRPFRGLYAIRQEQPGVRVLLRENTWTSADPLRSYR